MATRKNYNSEQSQLRLYQIKRMAADRVFFTMRDIMAITGLSQTSAGNYLRYLVASGVAHVSKPAAAVKAGRLPAEYAMGPAPFRAEADTGSDDDFARRVVVRQQWAPNHVRMAMDCLLFRVPKILQGTHA